MKLKKELVGILIIIVGMMLVLSFTSCGFLSEPDDNDGDGNNDGGSNNSGGNSGGGSGSSKEKAISVAVGYSSSHTISKDGQHWFKFTGTGDTVIFETTGSVVDTFMAIWPAEPASYIGINNLGVASNDNSGEGLNTLCSVNTVSGTVYLIRIETRQGASGTYTLVVKSTSPVNIRTNPISVTVGYSASFNISGGQYWYSFQGTGNSVVFETTSSVVNTTIEFYIGDSSSAILTDKNRISFSTLLGKIYYLKITSNNSGTYTFSVRNGTGDGSSKQYAIPVTVGYSSSHTISKDGQHWFSFTGTGDTVIFETTGNVVDTYMAIWPAEPASYVGINNLGVASNDNSGEGLNALCSVNTVSGTVYFIRIETRQGTSGTYTLVVK